MNRQVAKDAKDGIAREERRDTARYHLQRAANERSEPRALEGENPVAREWKRGVRLGWIVAWDTRFRP
jgi:hypothetical protein